MKNSIKALIAFVLGAGSGAGTVYYILKNKYTNMFDVKKEY